MRESPSTPPCCWRSRRATPGPSPPGSSSSSSATELRGDQAVLDQAGEQLEGQRGDLFERTVFRQALAESGQGGTRFEQRSHLDLERGERSLEDEGFPAPDEQCVRL